MAVFGLLNTLNAVWLVKLVKMVGRNERRAQGIMADAAPSKADLAAAAVAAAGGKPGVTADGTAAVRITATSAKLR